MTKKFIKGVITLVSFYIILFQISCKKQESEVPTVSTDSISAITGNSAVCGGTIISDGGGIIRARGVCWSQNNMPTLEDNTNDEGAGTANFISKMTNLEPSTIYYVRAYATNISGTAYGEVLSFTTREKTSGVTDIDGHFYKSVVIGTQVWITENLKTTHYTDGTEIPFITDNNEWGNLADNDTDRAYCYYNNNANGEAETYGVLYTWAAATNGLGSDSINQNIVQGVCPDGWHIPSDAEWRQLVDYISADGYADNVGTALKATSGWIEDGNGIDAYGFNALPAGSRSSEDGIFSNPGFCSWWSSTDNNLVYAYRKRLNYFYTYIENMNSAKSSGYSVRCIKDE